MPSVFRKPSYLFLVDQSHFGHVDVKVVDVRKADFHLLYLESTRAYVMLGTGEALPSSVYFGPLHHFL